MEHCNPIEQSREAWLDKGMTVHWPTHYGWLLWVRGADRALSHRVRASSSLIREASSVWHGAARCGPLSDWDGCLSSPVMASVMNGLHCRGNKGKGGLGALWGSIRTHEEDLLRMLKSLIQPEPSPVRSLCCLLHHWRTSLWERVGGETTRRRQDFRVRMCGCMYIYMKCVSRFSRGAGMSANSRSTRHTQVQDAHRRTHSHNSVNPPTVAALKGATLWHGNSEVSKAMDILLMSPKQWLD